MAVIRYVEIQLGEVGQKLADLYGINQDLTDALKYCHRYVTDYIRDPDLYCIFTFFVVKYARCFNGGVRKRTSDELLATMPTKDREIHDIIYALRDKHVGHSVSAWESHKIRLYLTPIERGPMDFTVSVTSDSVLGPGPHIIEELINVIERLKIKISEMQKIEEIRIKEFIKTRHTMEEIYALDASFPSPVTFDSLLKGKGRKAH